MHFIMMKHLVKDLTLIKPKGSGGLGQSNPRAYHARTVSYVSEARWQLIAFAAFLPETAEETTILLFWHTHKIVFLLIFILTNVFFTL